MANQQTYTPTKHGKNALTGKGALNKAPGNASNMPGGSNHIPKIGKPVPGEPKNYSSEQQQQ